jgi:hypothetical protein
MAKKDISDDPVAAEVVGTGQLDVPSGSCLRSHLVAPVSQRTAQHTIFVRCFPQLSRFKTRENALFYGGKADSDLATLAKQNSMSILSMGKIQYPTHRHKQEPNVTKFFSIGDIAAQCGGCQIHRVDYALKSLNIAPVSRVAGMRLFDAKALEKVREKLQVIAKNRQLAGMGASR